MIPYLSQEIQEELTHLASQFGQPLVRYVDLGTTNRFDPLNKTDRYGEVCMVIRRPNGQLLTMKKTFYPKGAYRLLTGGIDHNEKIFDALLREVNEETGLEVQVQRFLAIAAYRTTNIGETPAFYTFAFLLKEISGTLTVLDEDECVEAFQELSPEDLASRAAYLDSISSHYADEISGDWADWGHFRAVIHRMVWETLQA